jgi:hypothetical protein
MMDICSFDCYVVFFFILIICLFSYVCVQILYLQLNKVQSFKVKIKS